jgi:ubiquitin-protein ligase
MENCHASCPCTNALLSMSGSVYTAQPPYISPLEDAPLTPKIQNKRRSLVIGEPISDTSTDDSPSSFDCQSLQRSLKRVRLTSTNTTPGELRLERDLRHAVVNQLWRPLATNEWQVVTPRNTIQTDCLDSHNGDSEHIMDSPISERIFSQCDVSVTVTRDEQDPMELILRVEEIPDPLSPTSSSSTTLHLHIPRLYPHRPPVVRRMDHARPLATPSRDNPPIPMYPGVVPAQASPTTRLVPRNNHHYHHFNRWIAGNFLHSSSWQNSAHGTSHGNHDASLLHRSHRCRLKCPSALHSIVVTSSPETPLSSASTMDDTQHHTVWITQWTPVHRITDLVDWLVAAMLVQEESSSPPRSHAFLRNDEKKEDDVPCAWLGRPMVSSSDLAFYSEDDAEENTYHSYHRYHNVEEDWISDGEETTKTSSRRPQLYDELVNPSSFLPPNRFHIGYSRSSSKESLGDHDPCDDSMDISLNSD